MKEKIELIRFTAGELGTPIDLSIEDAESILKDFEALSLPIESDTTNKVSVSDDDAIKFAEWIGNKDWTFLIGLNAAKEYNGKWVNTDETQYFTTTELYSIYKEGGSNG